MAQVNIKDSDKDWFDEFKGDRTQGEAFAEMVSIVRAYEGEPVDVEELADELEAFMGTACELGAYRGAKHYMEDNHGD
jgi:hypothetical protein